MPLFIEAFHFWIAVAILRLVSSHREKLFTPGDDAQDNDHGKNSYRDEAALYIHVVKKRVEFFHNLNFSFQKWFQTRFSMGGECMDLP